MLSAEQKQDFFAQGYIVLDQLFPEAEMALPKHEAESIVELFDPN